MSQLLSVRFQVARRASVGYNRCWLCSLPNWNIRLVCNLRFVRKLLWPVFWSYAVSRRCRFPYWLLPEVCKFVKPDFLPCSDFPGAKGQKTGERPVWLKVKKLLLLRRAAWLSVRLCSAADPFQSVPANRDR